MVQRIMRRSHKIAAVIAPLAAVLGATTLVAVTVLAPLHPGLLERDPLHMHVVIGGNGIEQARALAAHLRGMADSRTASPGNRASVACGETQAADAQVHSIRGGEPAGTSVFSVGGLIAAGRSPVLLPVVLTADRLTTLPELPAHLFTPSVPDPPPKAS